MDTDCSDNSNVTPTKAHSEAIEDDWKVDSKRLDINTKQRHQYAKRKRKEKKAGDIKRQKKRIHRRRHDPVYNSSSDSNGWTTSEDKDSSSTNAIVGPLVAASIVQVHTELSSIPPQATGYTGSEPNSMRGSEPSMHNTTDATGNTGSEPISVLGSEPTMPNTNDATSITGNILIALNTVPTMPATTTPELPITTTPIGCLLPTDTTTTNSTTGNVQVTDPSFELVSEPIEVIPTSITCGSDVIATSKTITTGNPKKRNRKASRKKGKRGGQSCGERKNLKRKQRTNIQETINIDSTLTTTTTCIIPTDSFIAFDKIRNDSKTWSNKMMFNQTDKSIDEPEMIDLFLEQHTSTYKKPFCFPVRFFGEESWDNLKLELKLAAMSAGFILSTGTTKPTSKLKTGCFGQYIIMICQVGRAYRKSSCASGRYDTNTCLSKTKGSKCGLSLKFCCIRKLSIQEEMAFNFGRHNSLSHDFYTSNIGRWILLPEKSCKLIIKYVLSFRTFFNSEPMSPR